MIELKDVGMKAGGFRLDGISFAIPAGAYGVLMGATGSGKTSLIEAICGLRAITAGRILVGGREVTRERPGGRGIGYVPQDGALFATMSVREHLAFALRLRHWSAAAISERVAQLAGELELTAILERRPPGLSGGERQRVALGRAMAFSPAALCLDEPLSSLDEDAQERMRSLLAGIHASTRITVLHVTHSHVEAERLASVRLRLSNGRVEEQS